ncbi:uncharacterized protein LOC127803267 [Diospyros lotus]|uniref:uncharacterized protein LOC127803267 n=1 Tax=Diospyros lotus TaxID=55363 RepID=UPI0022517EA6|nr:uncharacterized protein LOC127803267 [Diospyros lotus]XP_052195329.1 uncharacterized protein LOC127803267 [Diospyros lotus]XP_052195330.1 uncharacterized protein LOC127803267 [Diospyros lotus]
MVEGFLCNLSINSTVTSSSRKCSIPNFVGTEDEERAKTRNRHWNSIHNPRVTLGEGAIRGRWQGPNLAKYPSTAVLAKYPNTAVLQGAYCLGPSPIRTGRGTQVCIVWGVKCFGGKEMKAQLGDITIHEIPICLGNGKLKVIEFHGD